MKYYNAHSGNWVLMKKHSAHWFMCFLIIIHFLIDKTLQECLNHLDPLTIDGKRQNVKDHSVMVQCSSKLRPHHLLSYATGCIATPGSGWHTKPTIQFKHSSDSSYLSASTCALRMDIPITESNLDLNSFLFVATFSLVHGATFSTI